MEASSPAATFLEVFMKQVSNEVAVYHLAKALEAYDRCNPDIGFGYQFSYFVQRAIKILGLSESDVDLRAIL